MFCLRKKKLKALKPFTCVVCKKIMCSLYHLADQREEEQTKVLSILPQKHFHHQTEKEFSFTGPFEFMHFRDLVWLLAIID